MTLCTAKNPK